jgi:hypothetical protein
LVNAEAFGFGPTAAIADFFPYLRERFEHIAFIGRNHSLDLQRNLGYNALYDISNQDKFENRFKQIASEYDLFFTACHFKKALITHSLGIPTVLYDPLSWYWPEIPTEVGQDILYIAQNFYGVRQRLEDYSGRFSNFKIVPPIIPTSVPAKSPKFVLINLGGIQNPLWSLDTSSNYARVVIHALKKTIPAGENIIIATSKGIAERLNDPLVKTYSRQELLDLFPSVKYAAMTPGLANIHTSARFDIPTLFLPPANDSQGQQLLKIQENNLIDAKIDWSDIFSDLNFNYITNQALSLAGINAALSRLDDDRYNKVFEKLCAQAVQTISKMESSRTTKLVQEFGDGGAKYVADTLSEFVETKKIGNTHSDSRPSLAK